MKIKNFFLLAFLFLFAAACQPDSVDPQNQQTPSNPSFGSGTFGFFVENFTPNKRVWVNSGDNLKIVFTETSPKKIECYENDVKIVEYNYTFVVGNQLDLGDGTLVNSRDVSANGATLDLTDANKKTGNLGLFFANKRYVPSN